MSERKIAYVSGSLIGRRVSIHFRNPVSFSDKKLTYTAHCDGDIISISVSLQATSLTVVILAVGKICLLTFVHFTLHPPAKMGSKRET